VRVRNVLGMVLCISKEGCKRCMSDLGPAGLDSVCKSAKWTGLSDFIQSKCATSSGRSWIYQFLESGFRTSDLLAGF